MPYYAPLSLSQDFWTVHQWKKKKKKNHSQAYRSKEGHFFCQSFSFLTSSLSLCELTQHALRALAFLPPAYSSLRTDLRGTSTPCRAESSLQMCWLQNKKPGNSPAKQLASEPDAFVLDCNLRTQQLIWSSVRYPQKDDRLLWFQFSKKNLVSWRQWSGVIGDTLGYQRICRSPEPFWIGRITPYCLKWH